MVAFILAPYLAAIMEQSLESYQPTSDDLFVLRRVIGFQFVSQIAVVIDQSIRYVVRSKTQPRGGTTKDGIRIGWDDGFALFAVVSLHSAVRVD